MSKKEINFFHLRPIQTKQLLAANYTKGYNFYEISRTIKGRRQKKISADMTANGGGGGLIETLKYLFQSKIGICQNYMFKTILI